MAHVQTKTNRPSTSDKRLKTTLGEEEAKGEEEGEGRVKASHVENKGKKELAMCVQASRRRHSARLVKDWPMMEGNRM